MINIIIRPLLISVLHSIFGDKYLKKEYGIWNSKKQTEKVSTSIETYKETLEDGKSKHIAKKNAIGQLIPKQKGGIRAWELDEKTVGLVVDIISQNGATIHPSLNTDDLYNPVDTTTLLKILKEAEKNGWIPHAPSRDAFLRALSMVGASHRCTLSIKMLYTKKVKCNSNHPHLDLINKYHQNNRDRLHFLMSQKKGFHIAMDDLAALECDSLVFNGQILCTESQHAPTYNFQKQFKMIISSYLILHLDTKSNIERQEGKRRGLDRYDTQNLPYHIKREEISENGPIKIFVSDRTGTAMAAVKKYAKRKNGEHEEWSQPSNHGQHTNDILCLLRSFAADAENNQLILDNEREIMPYLVLTSDGGDDQSIKSLRNIVMLFTLMQELDLNILEKITYCPGYFISII